MFFPGVMFTTHGLWSLGNETSGQICLIIATKVIGYGTKGQKEDALVLCNGIIREIKRIDRWNVRIYSRYDEKGEGIETNDSGG